MRKVLFIDATVRSDSRTKELAVYLVQKLRGNVKHIKLDSEEMPILNEGLLKWRSEATEREDFESPYFDYAKDFKEAEYIVIAAPYWDFSFPATLKNYIENICICGLTFKYSEKGYPIGLCNGKKVYYVTTCGGPLIGPEFGIGYIKAITNQLFGIPEFKAIAAENLDIIGADVAQIMAESKRRIDREIRY